MKTIFDLVKEWNNDFPTRLRNYHLSLEKSYATTIRDKKDHRIRYIHGAISESEFEQRSSPENIYCIHNHGLTLKLEIKNEKTGFVSEFRIGYFFLNVKGEIKLNFYNSGTNFKTLRRYFKHKLGLKEKPYLGQSLFLTSLFEKNNISKDYIEFLDEIEKPEVNAEYLFHFTNETNRKVYEQDSLKNVIDYVIDKNLTIKYIEKKIYYKFTKV